MNIKGLIYPICFVSALANANDCEKNFSSMGDPRNGAEFSTSADLTQVTTDSALGQLRGIAIKDGFNVINEESTAQNGTLVIEQKKGVRHPFLIYFTAEAKSGFTTVSVRTRLNKKVTAKPEDMRQGMCGMIARVKPGKEGESIAAKVHAEAPKPKVTVVKAITLAREFDDIVRKQSPEIINQKYKGKVYQLDGQIKIPLETDEGLEIWYDVVREGNWLVAGELTTELTRTQIVCVLSKDQLKQGNMLQKDDWAKLTGTVSHYHVGTPNKLVFKNCQFN